MSCQKRLRVDGKSGLNFDCDSSIPNRSQAAEIDVLCIP